VLICQREYHAPLKAQLQACREARAICAEESKGHGEMRTTAAGFQPPDLLRVKDNPGKRSTSGNSKAPWVWVRYRNDRSDLRGVSGHEQADTTLRRYLEELLPPAIG
jgi:hypothetical protein